MNLRYRNNKSMCFDYHASEIPNHSFVFRVHLSSEFITRVPTYAWFDCLEIFGPLTVVSRLRNISSQYDRSNEETRNESLTIEPGIILNCRNHAPNTDPQYEFGMTPRYWIPLYFEKKNTILIETYDIV